MIAIIAVCPEKEVMMSRIAQKARKRQNRSLKRQEEHKKRMVEALTKPPEDEEALSRRNMYGKADLTAYYALFNVLNPDRKPRYGF